MRVAHPIEYATQHLASEYILLFQQREEQSAMRQARTRTSGKHHSFHP